MDREDFLRYFEQVRERTMRVVRAIPEDKVEWTCRTGEFTFGDLARHIAATERYVCICRMRLRAAKPLQRMRPRARRGAQRRDCVHGANACEGDGDFLLDVR